MPRRKSATEASDCETQTVQSEMSAELLEAPAEMVAEETVAAKPVKTKGERMTGDDLLVYVRENKDAPADDVIYGAGYFTKTVDPSTGESKTTLHKPQFYEAIAAANGVSLAPPKRAFAARKGRKPIVTVVKNGNIVVGARHGAIAGFEPQSKVKIEAEHGRIVLTAWQDEDGAADDDDDLDL